SRPSARGHHALVLAVDATPLLTGFPNPITRLVNTILATGNLILLTPSDRPSAIAHRLSLEPDQYFSHPPGRGYLTTGRAPLLVQLAMPPQTS
ncbi:hypothetical protein, partial [Streptomyces sp. URMC 123]|uniref:hypothetical protein n=1 Tax=Streptomyces sp. URMC 123 TaxID=3423403 RepID=UPI003F1C1A22